MQIKLQNALLMSSLLRHNSGFFCVLRCPFRSSMGNECSCNKISLSSVGTASSSSGKTSEKDKGEQQDQYNSLVKSTEAVNNSEDIPVKKVKEYKVLPPIRKKANSLPQISYKPNRIWGGSVNSYLDTINRNSIIDEDIITGGYVNWENWALKLLRSGSVRGILYTWQQYTCYHGAFNVIFIRSLGSFDFFYSAILFFFWVSHLNRSIFSLTN